jgi:hypothetical protein
MLERGIENNLHLLDKFHRMNMATNSLVEVDGENRVFKDKLLDELVGKWRVNGEIMGQNIEQYCEADWVLNHQFLRAHFIDSAARDRKSGSIHDGAEYEAMVFIGYDNMSERYVVHWIDIFGGRFSETLGYGNSQDQHTIRFVFEYPTGPLHNTFAWNMIDGTWSIQIKQKNQNGKWTDFADEILRKTK